MTSEIQVPSVASLFIEICFDEQCLATGTGFVCKLRNGAFVLLTNRHNVTGRNNDDDSLLDKAGGRVPNRLRVHQHVKGNLGSTATEWMPLLNEHGSQLWVEHPQLGGKADFVALRLPPSDSLEYFPYDAYQPQQVRLGPADTVSVVGFPFGMRVAAATAVWATGFIASEPDIDYDGLPMFLVDCRTRKGQSGSAVIAHRSAGSFRGLDGGAQFQSGVISELVGIYSGRVNAESDLGKVWKVSAIRKLLDTIVPVFPKFEYSAPYRATGAGVNVPGSLPAGYSATPALPKKA